MPDYQAELDRLSMPVHEWGSDKFLAFALRHKGMWVKIAQAVATRGDVYPRPYVEKCKQCQDEMPPSPLKGVHRMIKSDLGAPTKEIFLSFEPEVLGSARSAGCGRRCWRPPW